MKDFIVHIVFALPLTVMAMNFGLALLLRLASKKTFIKKNYRIKPRVSILLPCFNEGRHVFKTIRSIMSNEYPMEKVEIIAIDDCSADDTYKWLQKAEKKWPNVKVSRNKVNSGKHHTLSTALSHSSGEILVCIDSDCIFDKMAIRELTACFVDDTIGAVGGRVGISNPTENIFTQCQTLVYYYSFHIMKMTQNWTRNIICISGCLFAVRRKHFEAIQEQVKQRNWFGIGVRDGEDRYMTHLLLLKGLKTYVNIDAQCWTAAPNNLKQLFMQQLRWRRSGLRDIFWTLRTFRSNLEVLHPLTIVNIIIPGLLTCIWPAMWLYAIASGWVVENLFLEMQVSFCIYIITGVLFNMYAHKHNPEQKINPFLVGLVGFWMIVDSFFISLLAYCTFDVGEWGTRGTPAQKTA